ncbi:hypothetical protein [Ancylobacter oerskovii]|uniref:HEPN domain-containing protein n=1 Tax=Ancylobacter oerskovii TaxID=459519 RepID=A0ABW4Z1A9_9HYPH|nr:hypothetical protein [Ancylobacter oerskovii]MBS7542544.1 hypothetical protein [Ancylobacter oerskovii]
MEFQTADTIDGWLELARVARRMAEMAMSEPMTRNAAWAHAGFACECLLKASIMAKERLNRFPDRRERRELYVHDLGALAKLLGVQIGPMDEVAPAWMVALEWRRDHAYVDGRMPVAVVQGLFDAVFSDGGVGEWIVRNYLRNYTTPGGSIFPS